jgi:fumigallin biosynthesis monooxygenase-like protein
MPTRVDRRTVDLSHYPDLVVIYLGMRVNALAGIRSVLRLGPQISKSVADRPDGLLLHEDLFFSLRHVGMRQYWRDFESLERWSRSLPHKQWWQDFVRDSGGTGFWHETYFMRGGMEAIYDDMPLRVGFGRFAPVVPARGAMFSARRRLGLQGEPALAGPADDEEAGAGYGE